MQMFASFVAPDRLNPHPLGTPADIKAHYLDEYGQCMSLFGQSYGFDFVGNVVFGYIGSVEQHIPTGWSRNSPNWRYSSWWWWFL
jgi:hypothetical protein